LRIENLEHLDVVNITGGGITPNVRALSNQHFLPISQMSKNSFLLFWPQLNVSTRRKKRRWRGDRKKRTFSRVSVIIEKSPFFVLEFREHILLFHSTLDRVVLCSFCHFQNYNSHTFLLATQILYIDFEMITRFSPM